MLGLTHSKYRALNKCYSLFDTKPSSVLQHIHNLSIKRIKTTINALGKITVIIRTSPHRSGKLNNLALLKRIFSVHLKP